MKPPDATCAYAGAARSTPSRRFFAAALAFALVFAAAAEPAAPHADLLWYPNTDGQPAPLRTLHDWSKRRGAILSAMQSVMGPLPGTEKRCPLKMRVRREVDQGDYLQLDIVYQSEPESLVPAFLLVPKTAFTQGRRLPAVLCLPPTDNTLGNRVVIAGSPKKNRAYADELARLGFVVLAPAYPLLADYQPDLKALGYQSGSMKAIWDNIRGLDLLDSFEFVRPGQYGAIGHSLGGHNALFTAVFDPRIKVIVSSCGFDSFQDYMDGDIRGWTSDRYMPRLLDVPLDEVPFDFHEVLAALAPRPCFVSAPFYDDNFKWRSVLKVHAAAAKIYQLHGRLENLRLEHPNSGHDFPKEMRDIAYGLFATHLR